MRTVLPVLGATVMVQIVEGSNPITALAFGGFLAVLTDAFNAVGGMVFPSGAYIIFFAVLSVGLGGFTKAVLGEPLDSNVVYPESTMLVYLVGACSIWLAARLAVRLRSEKPWLHKLDLDTRRAQQIGIGSALMGQYGWILLPLSVVSTFNQLNNFLPLSVMILAYARTKETDGNKSFTLWAFAVWAWTTVVWGILAFTKQGMFQASSTWAIGALMAGYRTTWKKLFLIIALASAATAILTPVSQIGRDYRYQSNSREIAWDLISHPLDTRAKYLTKQAELQKVAVQFHWFDQPQGLLDRLTVFPIDNALIQRTDMGHARGLFPIESYLLNMIPRYLMPGGKVPIRWGNAYAHEIGMLGKDDLVTGISFTSIADAYHCVRWWGVTVVFFILYTIVFTFCDSLTGSVDRNFWASMYILVFAHSAAEGMLGACFWAVSTYAFGIVATAILAKYFLPYVGGLIKPLKSRNKLDRPGLNAPWKRTENLARPSLAGTIEGRI